MGREDSVFECYRRLIRLRRTYPVITDGDFELLLEEDPKLFAYRRRSEEARLLVVCNFSADTVHDPLFGEEWGGRLLVSNYPDSSVRETLRPYEARIILLDKNGDRDTP